MKLQGKTIGVLIEQDYQDLEVWYPYYRLREDGARVMLIGTGTQTEYKGKYGYPAKAEAHIEQLDTRELDGLVIPGGWAPDKLRMSASVLQLVRHLNELRKPIACICHGGWVLCSAGILRGRRVTSYAAIKDDMLNAGATWVDEEVVVDENLVTARKPDDLPALMRDFIWLFK
ncbi:type 1 glutamine amidotransferase [candidate division KSB1 bacterium]|nr:type 1 glutamine amidotransferase [candidate division KSB1 bacterium]